MNPNLTFTSKIQSLSISELENWLRHHNDCYWQRNSPEISDQEYDSLVELLKERAPESPVLNEMGANLDRRFSSVEHQSAMLSLEKCYSIDELLKWQLKMGDALIVTPKIDGLALSIRYDSHGTMILAATRGDGKKGDNITANVKTITEIPNQIDLSLVDLKQSTGFEVRGEVYMSLAKFNEKYAAEFANPRNLASGSLKLKDTSKTAEFALSFFAYDILGTELKTEAEKDLLLKKMGFKRPPSRMITQKEEVLESISWVEEGRESFDYEIDGIVYKVNSTELQQSLGLTAHHPKSSIAYKFKAVGAVGEIESIKWQLGRTGIITPVAVLKEAVLASGAYVKRASLHNWGMLRDLGLSIGAQVEIVRRGEVIPHVEKVLSSENTPFTPPSSCPSCAGEVIVNGDFVYCKSPKICPDIIQHSLQYFLTVIDVNGLGPANIRNLIKSNSLTANADFYRLNKEEIYVSFRITSIYRSIKDLVNNIINPLISKNALKKKLLVKESELISLDTNTGNSEEVKTLKKSILNLQKRIINPVKEQEKRLIKIESLKNELNQILINDLSSTKESDFNLAAKIIREIQAKKELSVATVLAALGIDGVGLRVAEIITEVFPSFDVLFTTQKSQFMEIHGIGESIASSLVDELVKRRDEIHDLLAQITIKSAPKIDSEKFSEQALFQKSVVFTGKLAHQNRKEAQNKVKQQGGKTPASVTKDLDYLVIGDEGSPLLGNAKKSSKQIKAERLIDKGANLKIISEGEFLKLCVD